jgi:hypothetical protein
MGGGWCSAPACRCRWEAAAGRGRGPGRRHTDRPDRPDRPGPCRLSSNPGILALLHVVCRYSHHSRSWCVRRGAASHGQQSRCERRLLQRRARRVEAFISVTCRCRGGCSDAVMQWVQGGLWSCAECIEYLRTYPLASSVYIVRLSTSTNGRKKSRSQTVSMATWPCKASGAWANEPR